MKTITTVGERIASLRKEKGLTGEKFAELLNVSPQAVSKWETNKNLPETALLPAISKCLGVSVDSILTPPHMPLTVDSQMMRDIVVLDGEGFNAGPSIAKSNSKYYIAFRHAPNEHDPYFINNTSELRLMTSADGIVWSKPKTLYKKTNCDILGTCVHALSDESILFTFYVYRKEPAYKKTMLEKVLNPFVHEEPFDDRDAVSYLEGQYAMISNDGGESFSPPSLIEKNCVLRGRVVQLPDGTILAPLCRYGNDPAHDGAAVLYASKDGGYSWEPYSSVCGPIENSSPEEPGLFMTLSKRLFCFIRNNNYMYYCISKDFGQTWGGLINSKIPGNVPFNALQLPDGRVMLYYGRRDEKPYSVRSVILDSELENLTSEREIIIKNGCDRGEIAYNWAEILSNNETLIVYYFQDDDARDGCGYIAGTVMKI